MQYAVDGSTVVNGTTRPIQLGIVWADSAEGALTEARRERLDRITGFKFVGVSPL